jgi:hypothetical protein
MAAAVYVGHSFDSTRQTMRVVLANVLDGGVMVKVDTTGGDLSGYIISQATFGNINFYRVDNGTVYNPYVQINSGQTGRDTLRIEAYRDSIVVYNMSGTRIGAWANGTQQGPFMGLESYYYITKIDSVHMADTLAAPATQYTLTMASGGSHSTTTPSIGAHDYDSNTAVTIASTPNIGYRHVRWNVSGGTAHFNSDSTRDTMLSSHTLTDSLRLIQFTVSYDNNGGSGTISAQTQDTGTTVTLSDGTGFTRADYDLIEWNTAANGSGTTYSLGGSLSPLSSSLTMYAQWQSTEVQCATSLSSIDSVRSWCDAIAFRDTAAIPNGGKIYSKWAIDTANIINRDTAQSSGDPFIYRCTTSVVPPSSDIKIRVYDSCGTASAWKTIRTLDSVSDTTQWLYGAPPPDTFTLTINITGNHLTHPNIDTTPFVASGRYETGTEIVLSAAQAQYHKLVPTSTFSASPLVFTITRDTTIVIQSDTFPKYSRDTVHVFSGALGTVAVVPNTLSPVDSSVVCTASVSGISEGYRLDSIVSTGATRHVVYYPTSRITYTMTENRIDSIFIGEAPAAQFNLTTSYTGSGSVSPAGTTAQDSGSAVPIEATPADHWNFSHWQVTSGSADIADTLDATTTVTLHTAASIRAVFIKKRYVVTLNGDIHAPLTIIE